ncbi:efflux transporter outer membrane subunit [Neisseria zalophi]|uniref:Efflux transporter outer membrane subunit n=1 Tax=Neisseria zalophi TaxID=640030 RepID=A0A5J6PW45_9NEIS|nr:efflux transporter outer membrane subunit [Neisseria zalophi]QEY26949.1 efflux transporter outer membrane subunit [Neisseria zalophi]
MKFDAIVRSWAVAGLVFVTACAPFGKQTPLEYPTAYLLPEGHSTQEIQGAWWTSLKDTKLNTLIAQALQNAPNLRIIKARFEQAQAQLGVVQATGKTQVGLSVQGLGTYVTPKPSVPQFDTNHLLLLANTAVEGSWSFDFWGKNQARIQSALGRRRAIAYEAIQARLEVAHAVAVQYFVWQALEARSQLVEQRIELVGENEKLLGRRVNANILAPSALYQTESAKQLLEMEKLELSRQIQQVRHSLAAAIGRSPNELDNWKPSAQKDAPVLAVNKIRADLLARRPDIAAQKALLQAREQDIREAKAEFYPNIELRALAGLSHIDAFDIVRGKNGGALTVLPAIHLPLFTSGALQSNLAARNSQFNEQVAIYDQTVLNAMRSAADAVSAYQSLHKQVDLQQRMVGTAKKSEAASARRMRAGLENGIDSLRKQDETLQRQILLVQGRADLLAAWSNLHVQLGGGFNTQTKIK